MSTAFTCNLAASGRTLPHVWHHTSGRGRAPLALRADRSAHMRSSLGIRYETSLPPRAIAAVQVELPRGN